MIYNEENRNRFRYRFERKEDGHTSYFDTWCYGNIYAQINLYKNNLKEMCLTGVSNDTHKIIEVISLYDNKTIYKD